MTVGGTKKGRPPKLDKKVAEDLIAEVQRFRAENACLKNRMPWFPMIWELRHEFKVSLRIEVAGIPRSTYYYYAKHRTDEGK